MAFLPVVILTLEKRFCLAYLAYPARYATISEGRYLEGHDRVRRVRGLRWLKVFASVRQCEISFRNRQLTLHARAVLNCAVAVLLFGRHVGGSARPGSTYDSPVCCQSVAHVGNVGHVGLICQTVHMFQSCGSKTVKVQSLSCWGDSGAPAPAPPVRPPVVASPSQSVRVCLLVVPVLLSRARPVVACGARRDSAA